MRKIRDDAKEDSRANPTIMATIAKSATRAKLKASYRGKKKEKKIVGLRTSSYIDGRKDAVDHGKAAKKREKTADMSSKTDVNV